MSAGVKTCSRCKVEKPLGAFSPHRLTTDGVQSWCKECSNEHAKTRRNQPGGRDRDRANIRARNRAAEALIRNHPEEFEALLDRERAIEGLPAIKWERSA